MLASGKTAREATDEYAPLVCCARKHSLPRGHGPYHFDCSWSLVRVKTATHIWWPYGERPHRIIRDGVRPPGASRRNFW